jgi:uncharacterized Zn finger protein
MTATAFILSQVDDQRFEKAAAALKKGEYTVRTTRIADGTVSAFVSNGKGQTYAVSLSPFSASCSCPDSMWKSGGLCKHATAVAVRLQQDGVTISQASVPNLTLAKVRLNFQFSA